MFFLNQVVILYTGLIILGQIFLMMNALRISYWVALTGEIVAN